jgi:[acyl-carrier-protein] S-malonyltransferase
MSIAIFEVLKQAGITPDVCCGLSLGEYGALYAAGGLEIESVIPLVHTRGKLMESELPKIVSSMVAILGASREVVQNACTQAVSNGIVEIANYNCPGQIVIGGQKQAVDAAVLILKEQKIRSIPLKVSGPFHTSLLENAGKKLAAVLGQTEIKELKLPVLTNVTGTYLVNNPEAIKRSLAKQVSSAVYFEDQIKQMIVDGVDTFIEIGPKNVLGSFVKKIDKTVNVYSTNSVEEIEKVIIECAS